MIYSVNFMDMAGKINSLAFAKYLKEMGWKQYPTKRTTVKIFQYDQDEKFEQVTIPIDETLNDYNLAMYNAVEKVASIENKSVEQEMLYLLNPNTDIIRLRMDKKGVESGNILFDDAIKIYDNAKKLIAATALDIINPKIFHNGRTEDVIQKFLSACRFGQTEIGSYVVSVVCPFAELSADEGYKQLSIFSDEETCANSLTRKVTNKLIKNICTIKKKIDDGDTESLVKNVVENQISVNFYEALKGLNLDSESTILEFTAEWSPIVKINRYECSSVKISNNYFQPITSVIEKLSETTKQSTEFVGLIRTLDALPVADKRKTGTVTIAGMDSDGRKCFVKVKLEKDDYDQAIEAHHLGKFIKITGELKQDKKKSIMDCQSFSIID